jgi:glycosyltransferase involved in cell wall biosynthesis
VCQDVGVSALVSVVMPTRNYGAFIARAIDSVLAQTHPPHEIIVVDDGSTDDTPAVLARYAGRIRVLAGPGRGVSAARNAGLAAARGELIAVLDADDEWLPTKLARQIPLLREDPAVGVVGCANVVWSGAGHHVRTRFFPNPPDDRLARMRQIALRVAWVGSSNSGALIHRRVLDAVGGYAEDLAAAEDWEMWLRVADRFAIRNVHEVLTFVWFHGTGMFRDAALMRAAQEAAFVKARAAWPEVFDATTTRRLRAMIERDVAGEMSKSHAWRDAARCYLRSLQADPAQPKVWAALARTTSRAAMARLTGSGLRSAPRAGAATATARAAPAGTGPPGR